MGSKDDPFRDLLCCPVCGVDDYHDPEAKHDADCPWR